MKKEPYTRLSLIYTDGFDDDKFLPFFKEFTDVLHDEECDIDLYFTSEGGIVSYAQTLTDVINHHYERINLYIIDGVLSCAFDVVFEAKCKKFIFSGAHGMVHRSVPINIDERTLLQNPSKKLFIESNKKIATKEYLTRYTFLTKDEIKEFKNGKDIYFGFERMKEILKIE